MQWSNFEAYSANCKNLSPATADAQLVEFALPKPVTLASAIQCLQFVESRQ